MRVLLFALIVSCGARDASDAAKNIIEPTPTPVVEVTEEPTPTPTPTPDVEATPVVIIIEITPTPEPTPTKEEIEAKCLEREYPKCGWNVSDPSVQRCRLRAASYCKTFAS